LLDILEKSKERKKKLDKYFATVVIYCIAGTANAQMV
jgi:hypothetical protein